MDEPSLRLNKHLALQLGISRREADDLIEKGNVTIDGKQATLGARFSKNAVITINDEPLDKTTPFVYLALNKPVGYVCSRRAQDENPTIYELLPEKYHALKPVGRLDKDSSGLILLSNDGDFAFEMTHPKFQKPKRYELKLDRPLEALHQQMIADYGVNLTDGASKLTLEKLDEDDRTRWYVSMKEGRNRQIRRTFGALGYTVLELNRLEFGNYQIGNLESGHFQVVNIQ
jgi:pseudouridine synthase